MADMRRALPVSFSSPTMSPLCTDEEKYGIVDQIAEVYKARTEILGRKVRDVLTVNGVRFTLEDGAWGLVRASSNTPNLVIVVESPNSAEDMKAIFADIQTELAKHPEIGEFDQEL